MLFRWFGPVPALVVFCSTAVLAEERARSPHDWLTHFSQNWREADWQQKGRSAAGGYMRPQDDSGWQARMLALQGLARGGDQSVEPLLQALKSDDTPQRILAAQALGYVGSKVPAQRLVAALKSESDAAVRLYLVDTLGMLGRGGALELDEYLKSESNRDVKRHVGYLRERGSEPLDSKVVESLKRWDARQINTAALGKPAPDFTLVSAQGDRIRLSDFRGKQAVVLVFIYGDT